MIPLGERYSSSRGLLITKKTRKNNRLQGDYLIMASRRLIGNNKIESTPKNTRQGSGKHTKYAATSRNKARKAYRGQGR